VSAQEHRLSAEQSFRK